MTLAPRRSRKAEDRRRGHEHSVAEDGREKGPLRAPSYYAVITTSPIPSFGESRKSLSHSYVKWVEAEAAAAVTAGYVATVDDLTSEQVSRYLNGLTSARHGRGHPCSAATKNRNQASLGGLATRLIQRGILSKHFIKDGGLKPFVEAPSRLPDLTAEERAAYLADIEARTPEFLPVFHLLMHTGADLGEMMSRCVRDVSFGEMSTMRPSSSEREQL